MKRWILALLLIGAAVPGVQAQQEAPPPSPTNQPKLRLKQPMTAEQRAQLEQRLDATWSKLPVETKERLMHLHRALADMPPDQRRFVHDRIERFLNMSPVERERLRQNKQKWDQMTAEERQKAREEFRRRRQEFEEKWSREHPVVPPTTSPPPDNGGPAAPSGATPSTP